MVEAGLGPQAVGERWVLAKVLCNEASGTLTGGGREAMWEAVGNKQQKNPQQNLNLKAVDLQLQGNCLGFLGGRLSFFFFF